MYFVRNLNTPTMAATSQMTSTLALYLKELLLFGGWSVVSDNGDVDWANDVLIDEAGGAAGFSVATANPQVVYHSGGGFTAAMVTDECALFLRATNGQNRIAAKITKYIDANNVEIEVDAVPDGWIDEGGAGTYIAGRVISPKAGILSVGAWTLLQAPAPNNNQARVVVQSTSVTRCYARPLGGAGTVTEIPAAGMNITISTGSLYARLNAVFDGPNALIYGYVHASSAYNLLVTWGKLDDVVAADTNPNFILGLSDFSAAYCPNYPLYMLNGALVPAEIRGYGTALKPNHAGNWYDLLYNQNLRLMNGRPGKLLIFRPLVMLANTATVGGCLRGRLPSIMRSTQIQLERSRPLDSAGAWVHLAGGLVVPRRSLNEAMPVPLY